MTTDIYIISGRRVSNRGPTLEKGNRERSLKPITIKSNTVMHPGRTWVVSAKVNSFSGQMGVPKKGGPKGSERSAADYWVGNILSWRRDEMTMKG